MFLKKNKTSSTATPKAVVGGGSSGFRLSGFRFKGFHFANRKILFSLVLLIALAGGGYAYYMYWSPWSPVKERRRNTTDGKGEIPPGTIHMTPDVPEGIEHEEPRPAVTG